MNTTAENLTHEEWTAVAEALYRNAELRTETGAGETYGEPGDACYMTGPDAQADVVAAYCKASAEGWVLLWPLSLNNTKRQAKLLARRLPGTSHSRWLERVARWYGFANYTELLNSVTRPPESVWRTL